jgi:hypothetical protein
MGHNVNVSASSRRPSTTCRLLSTVASFGTGAVNSLSVDGSSGTVDLYFGHQTCAKTPRGDIFEIANVG